MFGKGIAAIAHPVALAATRDNDSFPVLKKGFAKLQKLYWKCLHNHLGEIFSPTLHIQRFFKYISSWWLIGHLLADG